MDSKAVKDRAVESYKRPREELESDKSKKQKLDENVQAKVDDDDTAELKRCMEIVPEDDDEVTTEATTLSYKSPTIVDYKIYKEWKKSYFKIIRADGNSQNYLTFETMFKNFNREDLKVLRSIVKTRFEKTKSVNDMDNLLFQTLKIMFEHQGVYPNTSCRDLEAQMQADLKKDQRIGKQKEEEANITMIAEWDNTQAMMDANYELAVKLQKEERRELSIEEKSKLFSKIFEEVQQAFKKTMDWINNFVAMDSEAVKDRAVESYKRPREKLESDKSKKQKLDENVQAKVDDDDTAELKRCMEIVPEDDDEVTIEATTLSYKSPTIVDYKIYKEGKKTYFKIIRADGNSQNYLTFETMFKNFNREDLEVLRSIVKTKFEKTKSVNDMDNLLFQTLKIMFEHQVEDNIWKYQQGAVKVHD
nr:hypothetical protein [Tanacetum cinerariifolium]